jgi:hypothetical protein
MIADRFTAFSDLRDALFLEKPVWPKSAYATLLDAFKSNKALHRYTGLPNCIKGALSQLTDDAVPEFEPKWRDIYDVYGKELSLRAEAASIRARFPNFPSADLNA